MNHCTLCNKETTNPKFCSRRCSASYTNKTSPKRKRTKMCIFCENITISHRHDKCKEHFDEHRANMSAKNKTIGEYKKMQSVVGKHPSWLYSHIRNFARYWLSHLRSLPCAKCGYDKHVELAHIKALSEFSDDARLSEVNSENNIIQLCPNCHWEFDNLPRQD